MEEITKTCAYCGQEFTTTDKQKKYCDCECRYKALLLRGKERRAREKTEKTEKTTTCAFCGKEFDIGRRNRYCSEECYHKAAAVRQKERDARLREERKPVCPLCGKKFVRTKTRKKYCSTECANEAGDVKEVYNPARKKKQSHLAAANGAARDMNMTYGQYKAMQYMKKLEGIKL